MSGTGDRVALAIPPVEEVEGEASEKHETDALDDFAPRARDHAPVNDTRKAIDSTSSFPSREGSPDAQLNLKGPRDILDRFKAMCKADRRAYYDMLKILMDTYERR